MSQLGFTFYPKDWWTSDSFYALNPFERYIYLELLFMMYDNGGSIKNNRVNVERRLVTTIKDDVWKKITDLMVEDGDQLTHKSVNKRLKKAIANRENGKKGGRPKLSELEETEEEKPKKPKKESEEKTQNNPPYKRERESEIKRESEIENKSDKTFSPLLSEFGNISPQEAEKRYLTQDRYKGSIEQYAAIKSTTIENVEYWTKQFTSILIRQCWKNTMEEWLKYFGNWFMKNYKQETADGTETAVQKRKRLIREQQEIANASRR